MKSPMRNIFHLLFFNLSLVISPSWGQSTTGAPTGYSFCGKIRVEAPFSLQVSNSYSPLSRMLLCKSQTLYFRTSLGLFPVSFIDYKAKTLTISHRSCSSSTSFVSPALLSAGFPSPPLPNSLLLFNCSTFRNPMSSFRENCSSVFSCKSARKPFSCFLVSDSVQLEMGFHPKDLNCSHYRRVYKSLDSGFELGTRISFEIPDHVPSLCDQCSKPNGNCGVGLRCICHPKECKDKVFSMGVAFRLSGSLLLALLLFTVFCVFKDLI